MFAQIFWGIVIGGVGVLLIVYTEPIKRFVGDVGFAEKYLGSGGTYSFLKIVGVILMIFGLFWATGTIDRLIPDFLKQTVVAS